MGRLMGANKDTEKLIRRARKQWGADSVALTKGNHIKFLPPGGSMIIGSLTGSVTSERKLTSQLKKAGLTA